MVGGLLDCGGGGGKNASGPQGDGVLCPIEFAGDYRRGSDGGCVERGRVGGVGGLM